MKGFAKRTVWPVPGRLPIDDERPVPGREPRLETLDLGVRDFWDIWDGGRLLPTSLASVTAAI